MSVVPINVEIDAALAEQMRTVGQRLGDDQQVTVANAIRAYVEQKLALFAFAQEGIDAADRGEVFTQEEVESWFEARYRDVAAE